MSIYTFILTGGSNNHQTTSEDANALATDFVPEGVVGAITNTSGVAPMTGAFAVNAQGTPNMTVAVSAGVAYVQATPSGQASQMLRIYNNASANVTIAANSSGSTKYDWVYISISAANAANPNVAGDNVATLVTSRSSSATTDDGTPPSYGYPLAVVTVANAASSITNGNITDARSVTGAIAASTNADGHKVDWWEEIGRTTLSAAGDSISVTGLANRKYLKVIFNAIPSGAIIPHLRFNNDAANNYNYRYLINYASASGATSQSTITVDPASTASQTNGEVFIVNNATKEKQVTAHVTGQGTAGAGNQATSIEVTGKWANTSDVISRVDLINNGGAGDFAIGSEIIILGHN